MECGHVQVSRKCAGLVGGAGDRVALPLSFWGKKEGDQEWGCGPLSCLPSPFAGPGRSGLQDTDWALPSLGLGRLGGPARGLWRPGGSGTSHAGPKPSPAAAAGPAGLPPGSPGGGRARGSPQGFKAGPRAGEEGAPPTQPSHAPSQVALSRVSSPPCLPHPHQDRCSRAWEGIKEQDDKPSLPEWGGGRRLGLHVSSQMHHQKITAALINIIYDPQRPF